MKSFMRNASPNFPSILQQLTSSNVDFVVVGGLAVVFQGSPTTTQDLDIAISANPENTEQLAVALNALHPRIRPEGPRVVLDKYAFGGTFCTIWTDAGRLDIINRLPGIGSYTELKANCDRFEVLSMIIPVASIEHLIAMKSGTGRGHDEEHVRQLKAIQRVRAES
jgi:predicted nucleotidyltransferase